MAVSFLDWAEYGLTLAEVVSWKSKDPSSKCGAVIFDKNCRVVSQGYNGFPIGVKDTDERYNDRKTKYEFVCHAEQNAILFAQKELTGCVLYCNRPYVCNNCAKSIIQSGISTVVVNTASVFGSGQNSTWAEQAAVTEDMFLEASVELVQMNLDIKEVIKRFVH